MPGSWDPETYQERARMWREAADALPPGDEREACISMARRYSELAAVIARSSDITEAAAAHTNGLSPEAVWDLTGL
jgi:hypothetical protein